MTYSSILFNGCSLCWGDELNSPYEQRDSRKVAEHFWAVDHYISKRGISNDGIARTTMDWLRTNDCDAMVIQFTVTSRLDGYEPNTGKKFRGVTDNGINLEVDIDHVDKDPYKCVTVQTPRKWKGFYQRYYHPQLGMDALWKNYYLLEQECIKRRIPYCFMTHDDWAISEYYLPCIWKDYIDREPRFIWGFPESDILLKAQQETLPLGHPTAEAHQYLADYIISVLK